ncbi:MAG: hypothetical protein SOW20_01375 [Berryella intestinalis]|uniref:hypothetical protein n=1 Tax=Berryella intestinalis TaxID=1531429 RepID=UPI002A52E521|nr:hypothetical protein [Berryella intestinalis]MDD7368612.1 hypothetical protein [Berryella intestinalis]MDY3128665.1 hypothetical protein [Berryella intestinalis]
MGLIGGGFPSIVNQKGQMTVELAVVFPAVLAVSLVVFNAVRYLGDCASFDRAFHQEVRVAAAAPAYGQTVEDGCLLVEDALRRQCGDGEECSVTAERDEWGFVRFRGRMELTPSLFGLSMRSGFLGIDFQPAVHEVEFSVDPYKPGVVL